MLNGLLEPWALKRKQGRRDSGGVIFKSTKFGEGNGGWWMIVCLDMSISNKRGLFAPSLSTHFFIFSLPEKKKKVSLRHSCLQGSDSRRRSNGSSVRPTC